MQQVSTSLIVQRAGFLSPGRQWIVALSTTISALNSSLSVDVAYVSLVRGGKRAGSVCKRGLGAAGGAGGVVPLLPLLEFPLLAAMLSYACVLAIDKAVAQAQVTLRAFRNFHHIRFEACDVLADTLWEQYR